MWRNRRVVGYLVFKSLDGTIFAVPSVRYRCRRLDVSYAKVVVQRGHGRARFSLGATSTAMLTATSTPPRRLDVGPLKFLVPFHQFLSIS